MARASRKRRLPIGTARGTIGADGQPAIPWTMTETAWIRCETAWGVALDADCRRAIEAIVRHAINREPFARTAPFADDAIAWLEKVKKRAWALASIHEAASETDEATPGGGAALSYAESLLNESLGNVPAMTFAELIAKPARRRHLSPSGRRSVGQARSYPPETIECPEINLRMESVVRIAMEVHFAAVHALDELQDESHPHFDERSAWNFMIRNLWRMASSRGLPAGINKSGIRKNRETGILDNTSSPFVAFVSELQRSLPEGLNRHNHSLPALATAMTEVTRNARREFKTPPAES